MLVNIKAKTAAISIRLPLEVAEYYTKVAKEQDTALGSVVRQIVQKQFKKDIKKEGN